MQKEFTKADLKDGMVVYFDDGTKAVFIGHFYVTNSDIEFLNGKLILNQLRRRITKIEYGEKVVYESGTTRMTTEEMRQKLEELTGEKIEVEPSKGEMIRMCYEFCRTQNCSDCVLSQSGNCCFKNYSDEKLKQCYEKVMEDGKKKQYAVEKYEDTGLTPEQVQELKERGTAKRPDYEGDGYDNEGNLIYDTWICPNCEEHYEVDYDRYDFCPNCGQRLDWSE